MVSGFGNLKKTITFTIPISPVTKKNSQQIIINRRTGRPMVIASKKYREYEKAAGAFVTAAKMHISDPVNVKAIYYMPTKRRVDLTNLHEALHDVLVKYGVLEDDNSNIIFSTDGSRVFYSKENPRTEVCISPAKDASCQEKIDFEIDGGKKWEHQDF